ncbi:uncharacterized protein LOC126733754 isoform X2 [Anthonomus grandis grandis]|uniref:uncharacterized protein LOC126733754 isoform X2 n=1 Tax=Anthonomus grandis grandis TaxID=2921223 RepID=UPI002165D5EC|nr:uncharacterized protein LOC126733754 isoform X2 [Anthonomus grandis grandis]
MFTFGCGKQQLGTEQGPLHFPFVNLVKMPLSISDWLEEQLEIRGIESTYYSRYIMNLFYADNNEMFQPGDEFMYEELKPNGKKQKRGRRARTRLWKRHADTNAQRIKRSAAVECLMSAVEQNCEAESLIDELCEKFKEVNSEMATSSSNDLPPVATVRKPFEKSTLNPEEKYFQAFSPLQLDLNQDNFYFPSGNLVAEKWPSNNNNYDPFDFFTTEYFTESPKNTKLKPKRLFSDSMKSIYQTDGSPRTGFKRNHFGTHLSKDNLANWEFISNEDNYRNVERCLDFNGFPVEFNQQVQNDSPTSRMTLWLKNTDSENNAQWLLDNLVKRNETVEEKPNYLSLYPDSIWSNGITSDKTEERRSTWPNYNSEEEEEEESAIRQEYQHRPKQAKLEVESALKEEYNRELAGRAGKIDTYDEIIGGTILSDGSLLSPSQIQKDIYDFGLLSPGTEFEKRQDNQISLFSNNSNKRVENWENVPTLMKCVPGNSAFCEYVRPTITTTNCFSTATFQPPKLSSLPVNSAGLEKMADAKPDAAPEMYFEPIKPVEDPIVHEEDVGLKFEDGTTFAIRGSPNKVEFLKTNDDSLLLRSEGGEVKRYLEYKTPNDDSFTQSYFSTESAKQFTIKFPVHSSNDKSCQTVDEPEEEYNNLLSEEVEKSVDLNLAHIFDEHHLDTKERFLGDFEIGHRNIFLTEDEVDRPDSLCEHDEISWGPIPKNSKNRSNCRNNAEANCADIWEDEPRIEEIWNWTIWPWSKHKAIPTTFTEVTTKLREECKAEADNLFSDLNVFQLSCSEFYEFKSALSSKIKRDGDLEIKRRHSSSPSKCSIWNLTSNLKEDCCLNLPTHPGRRSVTL